MSSLINRAEDTSALCFLDTRDAIEVLDSVTGGGIDPDQLPDERLPATLHELLEEYVRHPPVSISMDTDHSAGVHSV